MNQPPEFILPIIYGVEKLVISLSEEFTRMIDKDVEAVYERLKSYYQHLGRGKDSEEPEHNSEARQALSDEILNYLEEREESDLDIEFIDNEFFPGHPTVYHLYTKGLTHLIRSARTWRKRDGAKGYIRFIKDHVV